MGVIAQAEVKFPGSAKLKDEKEYEVLGKSFDLPSVCLAFDEKAKTFGTPAATGTGVMGPSSTPSATGSTGGTSGSGTLIGRGGDGWSSGARVGMVAAALVSVAAGFVLV